MIKLTLLWLFTLWVVTYAWKDWYRSLCALIVLMAVIEHVDMPKSVFGIQGLNPWNLALAGVLIAWASKRRAEGLTWDMPRRVTVLFLLYAGVVLVAFFRMILDPTGLDTTTAGLVSNYLVNTFKWVVPGLLLFDGCRSRSRLRLALTSVLAVYVVLALLVIRWMPTEALLSGESLEARARTLLTRRSGYHRVDLAMMLAGGSWAILATRPLATRRSHRVLILAVGLVVAYGLALTGGRMGYATWVVVGLVLGSVRWRRWLLLMPLAAILVTSAVPGAMERMLQGFALDGRDGAGSALVQVQSAGEEEVDLREVTSGRNVAWPVVIEKIGESPIFGYGRQAMQRTGLTAFLRETSGEGLGHPHNAYLEVLLDSGMVGLLLVLAFYGVLVGQGMTLFRDSRSPVFVAVGGAACALVLAQLVASFGSQTFYPREGTVGMWCAIGLLLRVSVERARALAGASARTFEA